MSVVEIKNLQVGFPHKPLVNNLNLKIDDPTFVAVIGHNGCGKTTFFRSLINQHSYQGEILIHKKELKSVQNLPATGLITLLEQKNNVNFSIPLKDLVVMGRFRKKNFFQNYGQEDYEIALKALSELNLSHYADEDYLNLSGGEQQLAWLAQIMLQDTDIILLDEPTQSLDVHNKKKVFSLMQHWVKANGKTVFCITHDIGNLYEMEGWILNLALNEPKLEKISSESVKKNWRILEEKSESKIF